MHFNEVGLAMVLQNRYPDGQATHNFISTMYMQPNMIDGMTKLLHERQKSMRNFHKAAHRRLLGKVSTRLYSCIFVYTRVYQFIIVCFFCRSSASKNSFSVPKPSPSHLKRSEPSARMFRSMVQMSNITQKPLTLACPLGSGKMATQWATQNLRSSASSGKSTYNLEFHTSTPCSRSARGLQLMRWCSC